MKVTLIYFKPSGKYYSTSEYDSSVEHMFQVFQEVDTMKKSGEPMPGLTGTWSGPVLVEKAEHLHSHPALIL